MIVKDKEKTSQPIDTSLHYKMYKDGKHWVTAGITTLMFSGLILGTQTTAHADTTTASTSGDGQAQATTGGNAVTQTTAQAASASNANTAAASQTTANTVSATAAAASTATQSQSAGTITQPVAVDHSQLDQAVAAAKQAGLNPQQQPTTSSTVAPSEVESAKANIESNYASQAAKLNEATEQQETANHYNDSKGDTTALDEAVKKAQSTPGLSVKQDETKTTTKSADDKSGIANWEKSTASDYASQVDAINKAIDAQKQENSEATATNEKLKAKLVEAKSLGININQNGTVTVDSNTSASLQAQIDAIQKMIDNAKNSNTSDTISSSNIVQNLNLAIEKDARVSVAIKNANGQNVSVQEANGVGFSSSNSTTPSYYIDAPNGTVKPITVQAEYTNLSKSSYTDNNGVVHKIAKIVAQYTVSPQSLVAGTGINGSGLGSTEGKGANDTAHLLMVNSDPADGIWYAGKTIGDNTMQVDANYKYYDENGNQITFGNNAWVAFGSINRGKNYAGEFPGKTEMVGTSNSSNITLKQLTGSSIKLHTNSDGSVYAYGDTAIDDDVVHDDGSVTQATNQGGGNWDGPLNYKYAYHGAVVGLITPGSNEINVTYKANYHNWSAGEWQGIWVTMQTIIPQTPTVNYQTYVAKDSSVSYHYNVLKVKPNWSADDLSYQYHDLNVATSPEKNWTQGSQTVNGKTEINDDVVSATVKMTTPAASQVEGGMKTLAVTDNYSKFANNVTYQGAQVYENDRLATSLYNVTNNAADATVTATRKNAATTPAGTVSLVVDFKVNSNVPSGTKFENSGSGTINNSTVPTNDAEIVTYQQSAEKHWIEGTQTVDGKTYINDDVVTTKVDMSLPDPSTLAHSLTNVTVDDDYSDFQDKVTPQSYRVEENGKDVTNQYNVTHSNGHLTAVRKTPSTAPAGKVSLIATWLINANVASGTKLTNRGSGRINNHTVPTNTPSITTYTQTAEKHWVEGTQTVDGKVYIDGTLAHAQVTTSLPDPATLTDKLTDVSITDDYSAFADKVDFQSAQVLENGKDVTDQYTITKQGDKITATRKDPGSAPAGNAQLLLTFKIHSDVASGTQLENVGSSTINNHTVSTNKATITTFKPDPKKDVVVSVDNNKSLNGANIDLNSSFDYKLEGSTVPKNSNGITEYGFHDDYDQEHDQYNGGYTVLLNSDVTLTDGTVLKKGTDVTKYTTQTIDQDNGIVDIEFDQDFLTKVDFTNSEFGATAYLKMRRVKAGDVENKYVNSINNQAFNSNTVKTHTDEPKSETPKNETPTTPQATTPETPLSPKTSQQPVFAAVQPAALQAASQSQAPSQGQQQLPQTGNDKDEALALTGLASLLFGLGTLGMKKRRRHA